MGTLVGYAMASQEAGDEAEIYKVGLNTSRLLMATGEVIIGWLLLRQAEIAAERLPSATGKDLDFYTGKIAAAKHFIRTVLPHITADKKILESEDGALMGLSESAF